MAGLCFVPGPTRAKRSGAITKHSGLWYARQFWAVRPKTFYAHAKALRAGAPTPAPAFAARRARRQGPASLPPAFPLGRSCAGAPTPAPSAARSRRSPPGEPSVCCGLPCVGSPLRSPCPPWFLASVAGPPPACPPCGGLRGRAAPARGRWVAFRAPGPFLLAEFPLRCPCLGRVFCLGSCLVGSFSPSPFPVSPPPLGAGESPRLVWGPVPLFSLLCCPLACCGALCPALRSPIVPGPSRPRRAPPVGGGLDSPGCFLWRRA